MSRYIDNIATDPITAVTGYETMQGRWWQLGGKGTEFSIFKTIEEGEWGEPDSWKVEHPILDREVLRPGLTTLINERTDQEEIFEDITWGDVASFCSRTCKGDHVYLEGFEDLGGSVYGLVLGS